MALAAAGARHVIGPVSTSCRRQATSLAHSLAATVCSCSSRTDSSPMRYCRVKACRPGPSDGVDHRELPVPGRADDRRGRLATHRAGGATGWPGTGRIAGRLERPSVAGGRPAGAAGQAGIARQSTRMRAPGPPPGDAGAPPGARLGLRRRCRRCEVRRRAPGLQGRTPPSKGRHAIRFPPGPRAAMLSPGRGVPPGRAHSPLLRVRRTSKTDRCRVTAAEQRSTVPSGRLIGASSAWRACPVPGATAKRAARPTGVPARLGPASPLRTASRPARLLASARPGRPG